MSEDKGGGGGGVGGVGGVGGGAWAVEEAGVLRAVWAVGGGVGEDKGGAGVKRRRRCVSEVGSGEWGWCGVGGGGVGRPVGAVD